VTLAKNSTQAAASLARGGCFVPDSAPSYESMKDLEAAPRARKEQALARVASLYEAWKKPEKAAMWRAKAPSEPGQ
jgi:hypothetical protein